MVLCKGVKDIPHNRKGRTMENKYRVGQNVRFNNAYAYPSLSGSYGVVRDLPGEDYPYYTVRFTTGKMSGKSMSVRECELTAMED